MTIDAITDIIGIIAMVDISKAQKGMTTISVKKATALKLQGLASWGETYDTVILRLLNGSNPGREGETHEDRGDARDEFDGVGHHQDG